MKILFFFLLSFSTYGCFGQYITLDSIMPAEADYDDFHPALYAKRKKYSSKKKFEKYCAIYYEFAFYANLPTLLPVSPILVKHFKIPAQERLELYPFNTYDSIQLIYISHNYIEKDKYTVGLDTIVLDRKGKEILSDVLFNYVYNERPWVMFSGYNNEDYRDNLYYKLEFFDTKTGKSRYISCFSGNHALTNFNHYEQHLLDIQWDKVEKFVEKMKLKNYIWYKE